MARICVKRKEESQCGCEWCLGHETITRQIISLEIEGMTNDQIDKLIRDRFADDIVLHWRLWSEAEYMRSIGARELPFSALKVNP